MAGVDRDPNHLYPPFRTKVFDCLSEAEEALNRTLFKNRPDKFVFAETLRTVERQAWLWASGRSRPGPIVTKIRDPRWHGIGLAADVMFKERGYDAPHEAWVVLHELLDNYGLSNPAYSFGDYGHMQPPPSDEAIRRKAREWVRAGFPAAAPVPPAEVKVSVFVGADSITDAYAYLSFGKVYLWVRSIVEELEAIVVGVEGSQATVVRTDWMAAGPNGEPEGEEVLKAILPLTFKDVSGARRGFIKAADLTKLGCGLNYDSKQKKLVISP